MMFKRHKFFRWFSCFLIIGAWSIYVVGIVFLYLTEQNISKLFDVLTISCLILFSCFLISYIKTKYVFENGRLLINSPFDKNKGYDLSEIEQIETWKDVLLPHLKVSFRNEIKPMYFLVDRQSNFYDLLKGVKKTKV